MGNVISYSGISTKVRAMRRQLLTEQEFLKLSECRSSEEKAEYLSGFPAYREAFLGASEAAMNRKAVERRLRLSLLRDFNKLYRFGNEKQKRFMKLYFEHFEVQMVRACLEAVLSGRPAEFGLELYEAFLRKYAKIDILTLSRSRDLAAFIDNLSGTPYHSILRRLYESGHARPVDYETAIDMRYFNTMWRLKGKILSKEEQKLLEQSFGSRIDLLNLNWIYRAKKYYRMSPAEIYTLLIPIRYKIRIEEMKRLVETPGIPEFLAAEYDGYYGERLLSYIEAGTDFAGGVTALLEQIYRREAKNNPYSIAPLNTYFYLKEQEINRIVRTVELTHYGEKKETEKGEAFA